MDGSGATNGRWADPRRCYPEYPPGSVIEIRVHGVGGEPPSGMTRDPAPILVGGDDLAGFHRARNPVVGEAGPPVDEGRRQPLHVREVLAWGGQTSGTVRHAFWVLLLPFALFNIAGRMHSTGDPVRASRHRAACRVLALTLTLSVVALVCGVTFDLIAVQCGGWAASCLGSAGDGPLLLAPFRRFEGDVIGRLGLAALVPTLLLIALWYSGRYGTIRLEGQEAGAPTGDARPAGEPTSLADRDFWRNAWPASRLRGLHASAAFAWIGGTLALAIHLVHLELGATRGAAGLWPLLAATAAATVVACLVVAWSSALSTPGADVRLHRLLAVLRLAGLGTLGVGLGVAFLGRAVTADGAPGWWLTVVAVAGLLVVAWWAFGDRWLRGPAGRGSAFAIGDPDVPDVSISVANGALLGGTLLLGAAADGLLDVLVATDPFGAPSLGTVVGLPGWLEGLDGLLPGVFTAPYLPLIGLVVVQACLVAWLGRLAVDARPVLRADRSPLDDGSPVVGNQTAVVVALLSLLLVTAIGAGVHALVLDALGDGVSASEHPGFVGEVVHLTLPWWYALTALVVAVAPLLGLAVWIWLSRARKRAAPSAAEVDAHLTHAYERTGIRPGPDPEAEADRLDAVGKAWMTQRLIRDLGPLLVWTVLPLTLAVLAAIVLLRVRDGGFGAPLPFVAVATWVVALIPVAGVALIRSSLRDRGARRDVGRLWDVLTFWPRVTHPFAPPCYGEALVPMLEDRVRRLLGATRRHRPPAHTTSDGPASGNGDGGAQVEPLDYRVILAGHSQGSVVSLAVAARLGDAAGGRDGIDQTGAARRRVALVTYGSPIAILYERYFRATLADPAGGSVYDEVTATVHSWHHLLGLTEPFAFPFWSMGSDPGDAAAAWKGWPVTRALPGADEPCEVCDVHEGPPAVRHVERVVCDPERWSLWDGRPVAIGGHSVYHRDPQVDAHLSRIAAALVAASPTGSTVDRELRAGRWWRVGV